MDMVPHYFGVHKFIGAIAFINLMQVFVECVALHC